MRERSLFNPFVDLKPMERFEDGSDTCGLRSLNLGRKYTGYAANLVPPISERFHTYHVGECLKIDYDAIVHIRAFWG